MNWMFVSQSKCVLEPVALTIYLGPRCVLEPVALTITAVAGRRVATSGRLRTLSGTSGQTRRSRVRPPAPPRRGRSTQLAAPGRACGLGWC